MITLLRYNTPFFLHNILLVITFDLCGDVSLYSTLGLPMILLLRVLLNFETGTLNFPIINVDFPLHKYKLGVGIRFEELFNRETFIVTTHSYIRHPQGKFVLHVSTCKNSYYFDALTHSNILIVRDSWSEGTLSRAFDPIHSHT